MLPDRSSVKRTLVLKALFYFRVFNMYKKFKDKSNKEVKAVNGKSFMFPYISKVLVLVSIEILGWPFTLI